MILLLGGARSGKSSLAGHLAEGPGAPVRFIATALPDDEEMKRRIDEHRRQRPQGWVVVDAPIDVEGALSSADRSETVVIDCLTLWISNLMETESDESILAAVDRVAAIAGERTATTIVVSNEVGAGLVPMSAVGRRFRDLQGRTNQRFARTAQITYLVVAGKTLRLEDPTDGL